jgi:N-acetylglucosaminyl-diphospho-decaprenol L-rhamnosyltransferase
VIADNLALVTVHYGDPALTTAALASVWRGTVVPGQVIVVDNDPRPLKLANSAAQPVVTNIIRSGANLGFAAAVNRALLCLSSKVELIWLLNNDAIAQPTALSALLEACRLLPHAIISSRVLVDNSKPWFQSAYFLPWRLEGRHSLRAWPRLVRYRGLPTDDINIAPAAVSPLMVTYVPFCSVIIPRQLFRSVGMLDESLFVYGEDVDFCLRAQRAGFRVAIAPGSVVHHKESASTNPVDREYLKARTSALLVRRHFPWMLPYAIAGASMTGLKRALARGESWPLCARVRGYIHAIFA